MTLAAPFVLALAAAGVFRCEGPDGALIYSDRPCAPAAAPAGRRGARSAAGEPACAAVSPEAPQVIRCFELWRWIVMRHPNFAFQRHACVGPDAIRLSAEAVSRDGVERVAMSCPLGPRGEIDRSAAITRAHAALARRSEAR